MLVYVLNKNGEPLMPTSKCGKVKHLLKKGLAKVVKRTPFTIKLLYETTEYKQPITLGIDAGSKTIGISASTKKRELYASEVKPRNDVVKHLETRREFRRTRRNRKTRYRQPRFDNRVHSKQKGWLAPSVEVKIQNHISAIKRVCKILPITEVIVETAEFDLQALKAELNGQPKPQGVEYQLGEMFGFYNTRQYTLYRDGYKCRVCGKKEGKLYVTNAEGKETVSPEDSYTICEHCAKFYAGKKLPIKKRRFWTHPTFMGIMRKTLIKRLKNELSIPVEETMGATTKMVREGVGLEKSHITDARCIARHPYATPLNYHFLEVPKRVHNRQLHKATILKGGVRKSNQAPNYVFNYKLYDKVLYEGTPYFVWGRRTSGSFKLRTLKGDFVKDGVSYKKLTLIERSQNTLIERRSTA